MSPAGLAKVFSALAAVVLAIGAGFATLGAWLVLPFAGLEALALVAAYLAYAKRFGAEEKQADTRLIRGLGHEGK
jgi:uncharacterized membrane protein